MYYNYHVIVQMRVQAYDGQVSKSFCLCDFIKVESLPVSIRDGDAGAIFLINAATTYIDLMNLDTDMEKVDIRFQNTQKSNNSLERFLQEIFTHLESAGVQSVKELYLPQIVLHDDSGSNLLVVFQVLSGISCDIQNVHLPISILQLPVSLLSKLKPIRVGKFIICSNTTDNLDKLICELNQSELDVNFTLHYGDISVPHNYTPGQPPSLEGVSDVEMETVDPFKLECSLNTNDSWFQVQQSSKKVS